MPTLGERAAEGGDAVVGVHAGVDQRPGVAGAHEVDVDDASAASGSGRKTCTTPSATSRVLAASRMLLVELLLHGEGDPHAHAPGAHAAVLDHGGDAVDLDLGLDALDGGGGAR